MPRSLFSFTDSTYSGKDLTLPEYSRYEWAEDLKKIYFDNTQVLVNNNNGGWVIFDSDETELANTGCQPPREHLGEFLYQKGLCKKNGNLLRDEEDDFYRQNLYLFEFAVTDACNLKCQYCFMDALPSSGKTPAKETAELFIDRIAEYRVKLKTPYQFVIEFTGGEPLVNYPLIRYTIEYANKKYGDLLNVHYCLQSNLTLLTEEMIEFFKENDVGLGISYDGFKSIQDKQRPLVNGKGSFQLVESAINKLIKLYPKSFGSTITVITENGINVMPEISLYLYAAGFLNIALKPVSTLGRASDKKRNSTYVNAFTEGLYKILDTVITPLFEEKGSILRERNLELTFSHLLRSKRGHMCERTPCGGAHNICVVSPEGKVYSCNQSIGNEKFLMGDIFSNSFHEMLNSKISIEFKSRAIKNISNCSSCEISGWCGTSCPYETYMNSGSLYEHPSECSLIKQRYMRALSGLINNEFNLSVISGITDIKNLSWDIIKEKEMIFCHK